MLIRLQPKEWMMYAVYLIFDEDFPDVEDESVKEYVAKNNLVPKQQGKAIYDDEEREVMYFGQCYLGPHLQAIQSIQKEMAGDFR